MVDDIDAEVAALKSRGVTFEEYDLPGCRTADGVCRVEGVGRAGYFKDSEGNLLGLVQFG
ncbi:VOC family protein [Streptomyces sp. NPDC020858]|uniref:VOC family protein n=1 Tax=Streptomyces sp. NPDC020858 TaxID=3365097 RepID=UPI00379D09A9